jgi:hypothetical protein
LIKASQHALHKQSTHYKNMHTKAITRSLEQLPKNESSQGTSIKDYEEHARYKWNTELQALQLYNPPDEVAYHDVSPIIGYHGNGLCSIHHIQRNKDQPLRKTMKDA